MDCFDINLTRTLTLRYNKIWGCLWQLDLSSIVTEMMKVTLVFEII